MIVHDRGLTLLELTVAMAIFAMVAVMGLQALGGTVLLRDRLSERHDRTWAVAGALSRLRADLQAGAALAFTAPDGTAAAPLVVDAAANTFSLSLAGAPILPGTAETGLGRVEWRLDAASGTVTRAYWPTLTPLTDRVRGPGQPVLSGVESMTVRALTAEGWQDGFGADGQTALPVAIEITLATETHGDLRVLVAR